MILVDSSIWVDHFRRNNEILSDLLSRHQLLGHPFILGEIMMGNPENRVSIFEALSDLPQARIAENDEVMRFVERNKIYGSGVGYIDAHLLASVRLMPRSSIWTTDRRMALVAERLGILLRVKEKLQ